MGQPFVVVALALNRKPGRALLARIRRFMLQLNAASGALWVGMGLLVFTGNLIALSNWVTATFGSSLTI